MVKSKFQVKPSRDLQQEIARLTKLEDDWLEERSQGGTTRTLELLDEHYLGGSSNGALQNKSDFVTAVEASANGFTGSEHSERSIRLQGDVAISSGVARLRSPSTEHAFRYLRVYVRQGATWRLAASQSARQAG